MFGLLFATYGASDNAMAKAGGPDGSTLFELSSIFWQTMFLLASSVTTGFATASMKEGQSKGRIALWLLLTGALGLAFLIFELRDFAAMWDEGGTPMRSSYWSSFYALVGLHGLHIIVGLLWLAVLLVMMFAMKFDGLIKVRLLVFAMYWHFLDIIWIGIFSFVFLEGLM